jgi:hypothetical protein
MATAKQTKFYSAERRAVYRTENGKRVFLFDALTILGAIYAADEMNALAGAHRCSEHLIATDHDLIQKCSVCEVAYA